MPEMDELIVLEWKYSPPDYFEEKVVINHANYTMTIDNGKAEAKINPNAYDNDEKMRSELQEKLNDQFLGVMLYKHDSYKLSQSTMCKLHQDGRRDLFIFPEPCVVKVSGGTADFIIKDKNGNITTDTRKARIEKMRLLSDLIDKYHSCDPVLVSILNSFQASVNDPDNELVHLYEIRGALSVKFGGKDAMKTALSLSDKQWSRLGQLANKEPLKQGRHRGEKFTMLRDATESELTEARNIVRSLIESYLLYLGKQKST
jgi:hypothetical protein